MIEITDNEPIKLSNIADMANKEMKNIGALTGIGHERTWGGAADNKARNVCQNKNCNYRQWLVGLAIADYRGIAKW